MQYRTTSDSEGEFSTYWFEKNLQGDIIAVYSDAGTLLATYAYDAWGGIASLRYFNGGSSTAAQYNPFRYRGYYRDSETGFYYLNSRYYDPGTGRFLNADVYASTGQGLIGNNMYAYCLNNPIMRYDPNGNIARPCNRAISASCYNSEENNPYLRKLGDSLPSCNRTTIIHDLVAFNPFNKNDQVALDAHLFSMYKGKLVLKLPWKGRSGSLGAIFLTQNQNNVETLRHEYGHTIQLEMMGLVSYLRYIAIPSINNTLAPPLYYNEPYEITADILGNVDRSHTQSDIDAGFDYLFTHSNNLNLLVFSIRMLLE